MTPKAGIRTIRMPRSFSGPVEGDGFGTTISGFSNPFSGLGDFAVAATSKQVYVDPRDEHQLSCSACSGNLRVRNRRGVVLADPVRERLDAGNGTIRRDAEKAKYGC